MEKKEMETKDFILSIRKTIERKKKSLNLDTELLYLQTLRKYVDFNSIKFPSKALRRYPIKEDINKRFYNAKINDYRGVGTSSYVYNNIVKDISKAIIKSLDENKDYNSFANEINDYIKANTPLTSLYVGENTDDKAIYITSCVIEKRKKNFSRESSSFLYFTNTAYTKNEKHYFVANNLIDLEIEGSYNSPRQNLYDCSIKDIYQPIAISLLIKYVFRYVYNNNSAYSYIMELLEKIYVLSDEIREEFKTLTEEKLYSIAEDNNFLLPVILRVFIAISVSYMLKEIIEISKFEEKSKALSGGYARTYMTKKNIPKKVLEFMEDNAFLQMFGFVEADEESDIEKLRQLEEEFKVMSTQVPLLISKDHAFRFRKLGNINRNPKQSSVFRTGGVYYPGVNTLAVDLDSVNSFIHEYFHLLDFTNNMLSLSNEFNLIVNRYRECMDEYAISKGKDSEIYQSWFNKKSNYDRNYYRSYDEIFARAGEIYIHEILNIKTSFNTKDFSTELNQIVYPLDKDLLGMIKDYYEQLFNILSKDNKLVNFNTEIKENDKSINKKSAILDYKELLKDTDESYSQISLWDLVIS